MDGSQPAHVVASAHPQGRAGGYWRDDWLLLRPRHFGVDDAGINVAAVDDVGSPSSAVPLPEADGAVCSSWPAKVD